MSRGLRKSLLRWYDAHKRELPWRETRDAYAIWVSEIMLQQTRVETALPYYERFLARFPTAASLAAATEDEVLSAWSGLGYYRRARLLHKGVREVVASYGGQVPRDAEARLALPGIGRYTAGAIGSIAFDQQEPIVDGNVARLLSRVHGIDTPLGRADTERRLWAEAGALVEGPRPGDLNQALMELGALVCTPKQTRCAACPVCASCVAHQEGRVAELPVPKKKKAPQRVVLVATVATRGADAATEVWLVRGAGALFGGLWGVPMAETSTPNQDEARAALREAGASARVGVEPRGQVTHVLSHRRLEVAVYRGAALRGEASDGRRAVPLDRLHELGVAKLTKKILAAAGVVAK